MTEVIGVRFRTAGKVYYFGPNGIEFKRGNHVIVETARGVEYGTVVLPNMEIEDSEITQPLKMVIRKATMEDEEREKVNRQKEHDAYKVCQEKILKHGLDMKLINAEYTFDNNKVLFYFTADGRVDFRELVKDLAGVFRTRIELRQVGVRDETKILGGMGICGRPLCCHIYLSDFAPVSIKMAKEQSLSLNPAKISGICGRLMCCLKNESDVYEELNKKLPRMGDYVTTNDGLRGEVRDTNVLKQLVKVIVEVDDEKEIREYHVDELKFKKRGRRDYEELDEETSEELMSLLDEEPADDTEASQKSDVKAKRDKKRRDNRAANKKDKKPENPASDNKESNRDFNKENGRGSNRDNSRDYNQKDDSGSKDSNKKDSVRANKEDGHEMSHKRNDRHGNRHHGKRDRNFNRENNPNKEGNFNKDNNFKDKPVTE